jgi:hypothetical protein
MLKQKKNKNRNKNINIMYFLYFFQGKSLISVLNGLSKLTYWSPIFKYYVYENYKAREPLKIIILKGNEAEKLFSIRLLKNLLSLNHVAQQTCLDRKIMSTLESLSSNQNLKLKELRLLSEDIMSTLNKDRPSRKSQLFGLITFFTYMLKNFWFQY